MALTPSPARTLAIPGPDVPCGATLWFEPKDPGTSQDWTIDVTPWTDDGGSVLASSPTVVPNPSDLTVSSIAVSGSRVTAVFGGGAPGGIYSIAYTLTDNEGRTLVLTVWMAVQSTSACDATTPPTVVGAIGPPGPSGAGTLNFTAATGTGAVRLTEDGATIAAAGANSIPIPLLASLYVEGKWIAKNTANADFICGHFAIAVQRAASGPPFVPDAAAFVTVFFTPGSGSLHNAPPLSVGLDTTNNCLLITYPGFNSLPIETLVYSIDATSL